jgi:hypothetical protein
MGRGVGGGVGDVGAWVTAPFVRISRGHARFNSSREEAGESGMREARESGIGEVGDLETEAEAVVANDSSEDPQPV